MEPRFARFFLNKALGKYNYFDDLRSLDGDLYGNLVRLKHMNPSEVDALDLSFAITVNGRDIPLSDTETKVTSKNRSRYVQLVAHHRLNVEPAKPCAAFLKGLRAVIDATWLRAFDPDELQVLVSGADVSVMIFSYRRLDRDPKAVEPRSGTDGVAGAARCAGVAGWSHCSRS